MLPKRYEQVIAPISKEIGAVMDQFAQQRGITMTLDISKLLPAILTAVPALDLTQAFIDDFNRSHPRVAPTPRPREPSIPRAVNLRLIFSTYRGNS